MNLVLQQNFNWLYERLRAGFTGLLNAPVRYDATYAYPGFHIFDFRGDDQSDDQPGTRAHFDLQWMSVFPDLFPELKLSFTLSISEPTGGASLELWPLRMESAARTGIDALRFALARDSTRITYVPGHMIVHDGLSLHAIGRSTIARPEGHRITLQGHGAKANGQWTLYW